MKEGKPEPRLFPSTSIAALPSAVTLLIARVYSMANYMGVRINHSQPPRGQGPTISEPSGAKAEEVSVLTAGLVHPTLS